MSIKIIASDKEADKLLTGNVICYFSTKWCGPCKGQTSIMEGIAKDYPNWSVYQIDADICPTITKNYGVSSVPSIFAYKDTIHIGNFKGTASLELICKLLSPLNL